MGDYGEMYFCCSPDESQESHPRTLTPRNGTAVGDIGTGFDIAKRPASKAKLRDIAEAMRMRGSLRTAMQSLVVACLAMLCTWPIPVKGDRMLHPILKIILYPTGRVEIVDMVRSNMRETYAFEGLEEFITVLPEIRDV